MPDDVPLVDVLGLEGEIRALRPIRLGLVGCGGHTYRNVLPLLRHLPDAILVACCDTNIRKARLYAQTDGRSAAAFDNLGQMLDQSNLDGVLCVVGFDDSSGDPLYPPVVEAILRRGIPVWMEKPPAADAAGVARMQAAATAGGTFAQVGFKKTFSPAVQRLKALLTLPEFGQVTQFTYNYSVDMPAEIGNLRSPSGRRFLDDFVHVASVLDHLLGAPAAVQKLRVPSGGGLVLNQYRAGVLGAVAVSDNVSGLAPVERLEIVGTGANAALENGAFLTYYPPGDRGPYGTSTNYLPAVTDDASASFGPRIWAPEFSLGNLHGGSHFIQGYYHQMRAYVDAVRTGRPPLQGGLDQALRVMTYMDALIGDFGKWQPVGSESMPEYSHVVDVPLDFQCPRTGKPMVLKDGWNYVCRDCGQSRSGRTAGEIHCVPPADEVSTDSAAS